MSSLTQRLKLVAQCRKIFKHHSNIRKYSNYNEPIRILPEVANAIQAKQAVVALESTIITHGMPYPHNLSTALSVEDTIREQGAVPATIAILDGQICVGLKKEELTRLAHGSEKCVKTSRRDFPYVLAKKLNGGTTVAGTMVVAHQVGIPIFVTGGIGGVHRGGDKSLDISADLTELGRTPVTVVSAGVKSILDIGLTLEYLETQGVNVCVFGDNKDFPDFFTRNSGFKAAYNVESPHEAALMIQALNEMKLQSGMLVAVPIPQEYEANGLKITQAIDIAVKEAETKKVKGRDVSPYILKRVSEITAGESLHSNIALIKNNAATGAKIAVKYAKLQQKSSSYIPNIKDESREDYHYGSSPVVVGGSNIDFVVTVQEPDIKMTGMTHKGGVQQSYGGVGRNVADVLTRLGCAPLLLSALGTDSHARSFLVNNKHINSRGLLQVSNTPSGVYMGVLNCEGEAMFGVGDMQVHQHITPDHIRRFEKEIHSSPLVILDGNVPQDSINYLLDMCGHVGVPVWYEPTDVQKAIKPWLGQHTKAVKFMSPNIAELRVICQHLNLGIVLPHLAPLGEGELLHSQLEEVIHTCRPLMESMSAIMLTMSHHGFLLIRRYDDNVDATLLPLSGDDNNIAGLHFPPLDNPKVISASGVGDCLAGGFITGMLLDLPTSICANIGKTCARLSLASNPAVPYDLDKASVCTADPSHYSVISKLKAIT